MSLSAARVLEYKIKLLYLITSHLLELVRREKRLFLFGYLPRGSLKTSLTTDFLISFYHRSHNSFKDAEKRRAKNEIDCNVYFWKSNWDKNGNVIKDDWRKFDKNLSNIFRMKNGNVVIIEWMGGEMEILTG